MGSYYGRSHLLGRRLLGKMTKWQNEWQNDPGKNRRCSSFGRTAAHVSLSVSAGNTSDAVFGYLKMPGRR